MKKILLILLLGCPLATSYAVNKNEVNDNLSSLNSEIKKVSQDLKNKKNKRSQLKDAIANSDKAIERSNQILSQLREKQELTHSQLVELNTKLPEINRAIDELEQDIKIYTKEVYQQIQILDHQETSLLSDNDDMTKQRKTKYLIAMLKAEQDQYIKLDKKLKELKVTNQRLSKQVSKIEDKLNQNEQKITTLTKQKEQAEQKASMLNQEIAKSDKELKNLQKERRELNKLLANLNKKPKAKKSVKVASVKENTPEINYDEPLFERSLAKPLNAKIIRQYGESYRGLKSNGVLYNADDYAVFAVSDGEVLYNSSLPGYGQVIVIAHGDNYVSVYGGIKPKHLAVGQEVKMGQVIANSGDNDNQPMGGVYFELRHFGKPVNPSLLVNAN